MLEIKDLSVQYGKQAPTIEHFNLSMKKGEIISVVGESGSGKTTVIRAVLGALAGGGRVSTGDIQFHGHSLLSNTKDEWRNLRGTRISMIFQDCGGTLNPIRKIGSQYVEYICTHTDVSKAEAWKKGCSMLQKMRLVVMQNGKVVDQGTRDEVMEHPTSDYTKKLLAAVPEMEGQRYV